jgi:subtilisin family serine protease
MKLFCATSLILWLLPSMVHGQPIQVETVSGYQVAAREALVRLNPDAASPQQMPVSMQSLTQAFDADLARPLGTAGVIRLRSRTLSAAALVTAAQANGLVLWAEPNYILHTTDTIPNDPDFPNLWALDNTGQIVSGQIGTPFADIKAALAWDITVGSPSIAVAVIDTGADYTHPDLAANIWTAGQPFPVSVAGTTLNCPAGAHGVNILTPSCDPADDNGHGTHVSGTIGAQGNNMIGVTGINWTSTIVPLKFLDAYGYGSAGGAVDAIEAAVQLQALGLNIRVINASWGVASLPSNALQQAINDAAASNILFVAAAGNGGTSDDSVPFYPASFSAPNMITVAATDNQDNLASFSDFGLNSVDLGAPGVNIESTLPGDEYEYLSGTSMSAAMVSGAAALLLSSCQMNTSTLKTTIMNNVDIVPSLTGNTVTGGRLNVYNSLTSCGAAPVPDFTISASPGEVTLTPGVPSRSSITVTALNGFNGTVNLAVTGLPGGVTASLSPSSVAGSGTVTLTLQTSVALSSNLPITLQGTSGSLMNLATVIVNGPNFTLSATNGSLNLTPGSAVSSTITVTAVSGFSGVVTLSATGLPGGVTASFVPPSVTGSGNSTLTLTADSTAIPGNYSITLQGAGGALLNTLALTLVVNMQPNFSISASPASLTAGAGSLTSTTITISPMYGFGGVVNLSASGLPPGATASFSPPFVIGSGTATLTITMAPSTASGVYSINVQGASGTLNNGTSVTVNVAALPPLIVPTLVTLNPGGQTAFLVTLGSPAPAGGVTVTLASSNPSVVAINVGSVAFPAGQTGNSIPRLLGIGGGTATVTASAPGYASGTTTVQVGSAALTITTGSLASGFAGTPYSQTLTASGGTQPYLWSQLAGTLPAGLLLNAATGQISGTPTAAVTNTPLVFQVSDSSTPVQKVSVVLTLTIMVAGPPAEIAAIGGTLQSVAPGSAFPSPLSAQVTDVAGNPISGATVVFVAPGTGATGSFAGGGTTASVVTNAMGVATSPIFTANSTPGAYIVQASVAGVSAAAAFLLTNAAGAILQVPSSVSVAPGGQAVFTVVLPAGAPAGGVTITLSSSNNSVASLNVGTIFIPAGVTGDARARVVGIGVGSAMITASGPGYATATSSIQVVDTP